jgi:septum formation protein
MRPRLILASASPRRRDLLQQAGVEFVVEPSEVDESLEGLMEPEVAAELLARRKALAVAELHRGEPVLVLGADTVVALGSGSEVQLLGKPVDAGDAARLLRSLSGSRHRVVTGVALVDCSSGSCASAFERTWVSMRAIEPREVEAYVASGEWEGKAGGYAIQETADAFVTSLEEGGFDNVVGLPVALALGLLRRADS